MTDRWEIGETLGKGASGTVYRAFNFETGETTAIKVIENADIHSLSSSLNEIQLLRNLHHQNIVQYFGCMQDSNSVSIIMEYCEGGSLRTMIDSFGNFTENLAVQYIRQVLNGLNYLHGQGIVHRDVKAANILTTKGGVAKLADFGISGRLDKKSDCIFEGSTYWMAPEVIELQGASCSSDIWSLGATAIEIVSGSPPYFDLEPLAALFRIVSDEFIPYPKDLSNEFVDFLNTCFQRDQNLRADTTRLIRHDLFGKNRACDDLSIAEPSVPLVSLPLSYINLAQYRESEAGDFSEDFEIDGELLFKEFSPESEYPFVDETLDPLYSRSWSSKFLNISLKSDVNELDKDSYIMFDDFISRSQINSAVWLSKINNEEILMRQKLILCFNSKTFRGNSVDLQLLVCLTALNHPSYRMGIDDCKFLGQVVKKLPFTAFELFQRLIESTIADQNLAAFMLESLAEVLEVTIGDELNSLRKLIALSNIPRLILHIILDKRDIHEALGKYARQLLLSISKATKDIVFELGISKDLVKLSILKIIKNISLVRECSASFEACNAVEFFCLEIRNTEDHEIRSLITCILSTIVRMDTARLNVVVGSGVVPEILKMAAGKNQSRQFAIQIVCELASFANIPDKLKKCIAKALSNLLLEVCWRSPSLKAIHVLLSKDISIWKDLDFKPLFINVKANEIIESDFLYYLFKIIAMENCLATEFLRTGISDFLDHFEDSPKRQIDLVRILRFYLSNQSFSSFWTIKKLRKVRKNIEKYLLVESVLVQQAAVDCLQFVDQKLIPMYGVNFRVTN